VISKQRIVEFLKQEADISEATLSTGTLLFSSGIVDSFSLVSLMSFIEDAGDIRISPADVTLDHFDSIDKIMAYVKQKHDVTESVVEHS